MPPAIPWLALLHPLLAVLFLFPVAGVVVRLGLLVRERRTGYNPALPSTVAAEHWQHGRWLTAAMVVVMWLAELYGVLSHRDQALAMAPALIWGLALGGILVALAAFCQVRTPFLRAAFCLLTWGGLLLVGATPVVARGADHPLQIGFWSSHYWAGMLLVGLLLGTLALRQELAARAFWRRLHRATALLALLLFAVTAITGLRDLMAWG